ncbi:MAG: glycosyltransferase [Rivularia sp. (in: Bacteria)]|nr:glycosyltransferase [Rivularia sp. MS3]
MKVLYFQAHLAYGAAEEYLNTLAEYINKIDFKVGILYPDIPHLKPFSQISDVLALPVKSNYFAGNVIRYAPYIAKEIKKFAPDIIHINDPSPLGVIAARLAGVKKVVITYHTPTLKVQHNWKGYLANIIAYRLTNNFIFNSPQDYKTGIDVNNILASRANFVAHGLDSHKYSPSPEERDYLRKSIRAKLNIPKENIVIGSVGRLATQKAQKYLVQAAKIVCNQRNNVTFVIFGEGNLRSELESQISNNGLSEQFLLPGFVNNIVEALCTVDIFTMSSLYEGLSYAIIEAAAIGIPIVATPVGGTGYTVADGETGFLVEPKNPGKLAEKINFLIDNPDIAQQMGEKGRRRFMKLFTLERMIYETEAIYYQLVQNKLEKLENNGIGNREQKRVSIIRN